IVANHARTSANSIASSSGVPSRKAAASSPTSSISHMNVPSTPRASSLLEYIFAINACKSARPNGVEGGEWITRVPFVEKAGDSTAGSLRFRGKERLARNEVVSQNTRPFDGREFRRKEFASLRPVGR